MIRTFLLLMYWSGSSRNREKPFVNCVHVFDSVVLYFSLSILCYLSDWCGHLGNYLCSHLNEIELRVFSEFLAAIICN